MLKKFKQRMRLERQLERNYSVFALTSWFPADMNISLIMPIHLIAPKEGNF